MRISDWSSDVCSSDLPLGLDDVVAEPFGDLDQDLRLADRAVLLLGHQFVERADAGLGLGLTRLGGLAHPFEFVADGLLLAGFLALLLFEPFGLLLEIARDRKSTRLNSSH